MGANKSKRIGQMVAIDIGARGVKFAVGEGLNYKVKLVGCYNEPLPADVYENGIIKDFDTLKNTVLNGLRANKIKTKNAVVSIESSEMIKREMVVTKVPDEDMVSMLTYEVKQYLPIDTDNYVIQYKELPTNEVLEAGKINVLMGAVPKDMVESHLNLVEACGLKPIAFDMHSNALEKLVKWMREADIYTENKTYAFIDFGHKLIDISIFENGEYKFNRLIRMGGNDFDRVLMHHLDLNQVAAEKRKMKTSVSALQKAMESGKLETYFTGNESVKIDVIKDTLHFFDESVEEISKVFKYYTSRTSDNRIDQVVLYGGTSRFKDIDSLIQERLEIPTQWQKSIPIAEGLSKTGIDDLSLYVNAIGALIRF